MPPYHPYTTLRVKGVSYYVDPTFKVQLSKWGHFSNFSKPRIDLEIVFFSITPF